MKREPQSDKPRRRLGLFGRPRNRRVGGRSRDDATKSATKSERDDEARAAAKELRKAAVDRRKERARLRSALRRKRLVGGLGKLAGALVFTAKTLLVLLLLAGVGLAGYLGYQRILRSSYFDIEKITIRGTRHALPAELRARIEGIKGHSIFRADLNAVAEAVQKHPWVATARVLRQLPRTLRIDVREHRVRAVVLLQKLYLVSSQGELFKRATVAESEGLPVLTGIDRQEFVKSPTNARERVKRALAALEAYQQQIRPALSEVNVGADGEVTFYLRKNGTALRFGKRFSEQRLAQLDAVWAALGPDAPRALALYLDHEVRKNRVVVRLAPRVAQTD